MADTVTTTTTFDGDRYIEQLYLNQSDGTGESAVLKLDMSATASASQSTRDAVTKLIIWEVEWDVQGFNYVQVLYDATSDDEALNLSGQGYMSFEDVGGLRNPNSTGVTGDIRFTTNGGASGSSYTIRIKYKKDY